MGVGIRWTPHFPPAWLGRVSSSSPPQKMLLLLPTAPHRCSHRPWSWTLRCRPAAKTLPSGTLCKSVAGGGHPALPPLPLVPGHAHGGWGGPSPADQCSQCPAQLVLPTRRCTPASKPSASLLRPGAAKHPRGGRCPLHRPPLPLLPPRSFMTNQYMPGEASQLLPGGPSPEPRDEEMPELAPFTPMDAPLQSSPRW